MTIGRAGIERIVRDTTVYDELFGMAQWQPRSAETLVGAWLTALEEAGCAFPVLGREQWASVASSTDRSVAARLDRADRRRRAQEQERHGGRGRRSPRAAQRADGAHQQRATSRLSTPPRGPAQGVPPS